MYEIDENQLRWWWQVFNPQGKLVEIRLLGKNTYSGYFRDIETLIREIKPLLDHKKVQYNGTMQAYFTLNEINEDLYSREQHDCFVKTPKSTTTDGDIVHRRFVLIDLDPNRAAGISASDSEYEKAHLKAVAIYRYLMEQGFCEPIITTSGNGYHCYLTCDMPNDDVHTELVKRFLQSLSKMFSDDDVQIDEKVFNPARIDKLIGTWAKKGSDTKDRKWRISRILKVPQDLSTNEDSLFQKIADLLPKEEPKPLPNKRQYNGSPQPFDLASWMVAHGIKYREKKNTSGDGTIYELEECPWIEQHSDRKKWDSALFVGNDGKITFNCTHSHCAGKTWHDVRIFYEPDAYDKPIFQPYQNIPQKQGTLLKKNEPIKYQIKDVMPELGEKWLTLSSIKKIDLTTIKGVKTGIIELDKSIIQLNYSEVSLMSGGNASGKSSLLNTIMLNIIQQGVNCALWSGELPAPILKAWIHMVAAGKNHLRQSGFGDGKYYVPNNIAELIDRWTEGKMFIYNNEYGNTWEQIFHDMEELLKADVKVFILDNLFSLNIDLLEGDKNNKQRELILQIKEFAKKNDVHIILVAHPRKTLAFLRKNDISGTSDLTNAVDNVFIIHRVNNDFFRAGGEFFGDAIINRYRGFGNVLEVAKNRMYGIVDLMVGMHYEIESRRFKNSLEESVRYGWEELLQGGTLVHNMSQAPVVPTKPTIVNKPIFEDSGLPFDAPQENYDAPF